MQFLTPKNISPTSHSSLAHVWKHYQKELFMAYLGHKNIQHTIRYTELTSDRFQKFWLD
ncbi:hypothetical protein GXM_10186 [Nostoc sphaeroides CCNUC1]|uniref:Integrase n=1 Tax=Nostoc sphaeroides CCNUC1 TaxID=2653204 RepID=A0A5P8WKE0_9NOSO|nr:hypothetical protein GXM_10186 [Nostoc sphaeroides CCNUC1]